MTIFCPEEIPSLPATAPSAASTLAAALYAGRPLLLRGLDCLESCWARSLAPTALAERFGERREGLRVAVIVNDMAEVNIDAMLVNSDQVLTVQDKMVEMQNGCICCTLRDDLIEHVTHLAEEKRFDYLLIETGTKSATKSESTGISEPMPVAATFVTEVEGKAMLGKVARLDTLVTVVDGKNFFDTYGTTERLVDRPQLGAETGDQRNIATLLADQIECANVIVINKVDLLQEEEIVQLEALLKKMNPKAELVRSSYGKIDLKLALNTHRFDFAEEYNISSLVFRSDKPFHPDRLEQLMFEGFDDLLRSKGLLWVAGRDHAALVWGQAGGAVTLEAGAWAHGSVPPEQWPPHLEKYKNRPYGDKRTELVFISRDLDKEALRKRLENALVTDEEFQLGPKGRSVPPFRCRRMTLNSFFEQMQRPEETRKNVYLQQLPVQQHLPELESLGVPLGGPEILQKALGTCALVTCTLFCGAGGIRTSLHFDRGDWAAEKQEAKSSIDNLFLQLSGRKRFRLFRPGDHDRLYARGAADPGAPHERFPRFAAAAARGFDVELGPGDALLVPRWWWHETYALSDGHAVNWWFEPRPVAQVAYERKKEEQRAKNEESEAKTIGSEVDQTENELHQVKQEITKLNVEIFEEQQKAQAAEKTMREEQQKYQEDLKTKQLREEQMQKMMALLSVKDEAMTSLEDRFTKLQRKAKAAKQLLEKEEKKAELQEQAAQKQLENERKQAQKIEKEEALKLQQVKHQLEEEAGKARKAFDDQVQLMRERNDKEVQEEKHKIEQKAKLEQHQIMEKVGKLKKELSHEQDMAKKQAQEASKKEDQLRQKLKKTKQEEDLKVEKSQQKMQELELSLEKQREVSNERVNKAKMKLQKLQEEVIGEEEALGTKKLELQRVLREAKDMESKAKMAEAAEAEEENHLEAKLKAASVMEHKGKAALQRQAEHQAAELQRLIVQQKELEQKQVSALEKQIKATQAKSPSKKGPTVGPNLVPEICGQYRVRPSDRLAAKMAEGDDMEWLSDYVLAFLKCRALQGRKAQK
eukprot:s1128_g20.t1